MTLSVTTPQAGKVEVGDKVTWTEPARKFLGITWRKARLRETTIALVLRGSAEHAEFFGDDE